MATENAGLLQDTAFWVLLATLAFAGIFWAKGRKPLLNFLDGRTARIQKELAEAARLREEAEAILARAQKQQRDALQTAQRILDEAQSNAEALQKTAETKLAEDMERREAHLMARIARAEKQASEDLRHQAADMAAHAAHQVLSDMMDKHNAKLVDESIGKLSSVRLHG